MKHEFTRKKQGFLLALVFLGSSASRAADTFDYPELMVTPRASERIAMEASQEADVASRWAMYAPTQVSAALTLAAGAIQLSNPDRIRDPSGRTGWVGVAVGGAWLIATSTLAMSYTPYESDERSLVRLPRQTQREQLARERMAEEDLDAAARLGTRLRWLSVATNLTGDIYMAGNSSSAGFSRAADIIAAVGSLTPLVFRYHWEDVAAEQAEYKKRIYAPIASMDATVLPDPGTRSFVPGFALSVLF